MMHYWPQVLVAIWMSLFLTRWIFVEKATHREKNVRIAGILILWIILYFGGFWS